MIFQLLMGPGLLKRIDKAARHRRVRSAWVAKALEDALERGFCAHVPVDMVMDALGAKRRVALSLPAELVERVAGVAESEKMTRTLYLTLAVISRLKEGG